MVNTFPSISCPTHPTQFHTQGSPSRYTNINERSSRYGPLCMVPLHLPVPLPPHADKITHPPTPSSLVLCRIHGRAPRIRCTEQRDALPVRQRRFQLQPLPLYVLLSPRIKSKERAPLTHRHRQITVWSNFEIADMDFWRGEAYSAFFEYLDSRGGFYYEVTSSLHPLRFNTN